MNLPENDSQVRDLFYPAEKPELLVFGDPKQLKLQTQTEDFILHYAQTQDQAIQILKKRDIKAALCDIWFGQSDEALFLNVEDMPSLGRDFFR